MDGLFFYWMAWCVWVVITFFMNKGWRRTESAVLLLSVISFSDSYVTIIGIDTNVALLILLAYGYVKLAKLSNRSLLYMIFACNALTLAYLGFSMYSLYDPIIVVFNPTWMMAAFIFLLAQILVKTFSSRVLVMILGIGHGNLLYAYVMHRFSIAVGSLAVFDLLAACFIMIAVWRGYELVSQVLRRNFTAYFEQKQPTPVQEKHSFSRTGDH